MTSVSLPDGDVPYGLHSSFVPWSELKADSDIQPKVTRESEAEPKLKVEYPTPAEDEYPIPCPRSDAEIKLNEGGVEST